MTDTNESRFVHAARELGPGFSERAARHDATGEFVADNYAELKRAKLFSAGVPTELGGGGASHAELCAMVRELAHFCPSTALALSMHTHLVAAAVWRHKHGQPAAPLLQKVAAGELVLVSTGAGDWVDSHGTVERVDGGYRVSAKKRFASGGPGGDIALTSAPFDDPDEGPLVLHFPVPLSAEGVTIGDDWDTLGMRATGSNTIHFDRVFVPEEAIALKRPRGEWHGSWSVVCTVAVPIYMAAYVGLTERAAELAREGGQKRQDDPHLPYLLGELENALAIAQMAQRELVAGARNYDFAPELERANAALIRKTVATEACKTVVAKAVEASGGAAFFKKSELERLWRDVQAAHFHPLPEKRQLVFSGRIAMGLSPV